MSGAPITASMPGLIVNSARRLEGKGASVNPMNKLPLSPNSNRRGIEIVYQGPTERANQPGMPRPARSVAVYR
jgi:hypothetical protein